MDKKMKRRKFLGLSAVVPASIALHGCGTAVSKPDSQLLKEYYQFLDGSRDIDPAGYIEYLRSEVYKNGELDNLPKFGMILHDCKVQEHLDRLGFTDYREMQTGTTDPNLMYIVKRNNGKDFIINRGLPGAGGAATQAAELYAMGVEKLVHIGTCGLIGREIDDGKIIISQGSYKDAAAVMLSSRHEDGEVSPITYPSTRLRSELESIAKSHSRSIGFTSPLFYFQPAGLIIALMNGKAFPGMPRPGYVEMENASVFETGKLMEKEAASMVVGADRYVLNNGKIEHEYYDGDCDQKKTEMVEIALKTK